MACNGGNKEMIDLLLSKGASVNDGYSVRYYPCLGVRMPELRFHLGTNVSDVVNGICRFNSGLRWLVRVFVFQINQSLKVFVLISFSSLAFMEIWRMTTLLCLQHVYS